MPRARHLDLDRFRILVGDDELAAIAGTGGWNTPEGRGLDTARIEASIAFADQIVEGFTSGRYPAGTQHPVLTDAAADIARYRLRSDANGSTVSDEVRKRYEDAMRLLRDVQAGRQSLSDLDGALLGTADGPGGTVMTSLDRGTAIVGRAAAALEGWR